MNVIEPNLKWDGDFTWDNMPLMIVLHHADSSHCNIYDVHRWHIEKGWIGCGYQYFVAKNGDIYRGRPENALGAHTLGANDKSIGICCEGNFMVDAMPLSQFNSLKELCADIMERRGIKQIYGHKELYSTDCPGDFFPLDAIKDIIYPNRVERWLSGMDIKEVQRVLNLLGFTDENGNELEVDGIEGQHTNNAKQKAKEVLNYIIK